MITPSGIEVPVITPGSAEWLQVMSASKIAAVMGLSPFESRFSLYHRMTGLVADEDSPEKRRGHYLEPAIAAWFADQRPDLAVRTTGTWVHCEREWQVASPDRIAVDAAGNVECVELKSWATVDGWGEPGTDDIPVGIRCQVMWQLDTLGLQRCHVAVILPFLEFQAYLVEYDPAEAAVLRDAAAAFLGDIANGVRPPIDGSDATYQVVRQLHPDIDGTDKEIPGYLASAYRRACDTYRDAKTEKQGLTSEILDLLGQARYATWQGERVAMRVPSRGQNPPFLKPCKETKRGLAA